MLEALLRAILTVIFICVGVFICMIQMRRNDGNVECNQVLNSYIEPGNRNQHRVPHGGPGAPQQKFDLYHTQSQRSPEKNRVPSSLGQHHMAPPYGNAQGIQMHPDMHQHQHINEQSNLNVAAPDFATPRIPMQQNHVQQHERTDGRFSLNVTTPHLATRYTSSPFVPEQSIQMNMYMQQQRMQDYQHMDEPSSLNAAAPDFAMRHMAQQEHMPHQQYIHLEPNLGMHHHEQNMHHQPNTGIHHYPQHMMGMHDHQQHANQGLQNLAQQQHMPGHAKAPDPVYLKHLQGQHKHQQQYFNQPFRNNSVPLHSAGPSSQGLSSQGPTGHWAPVAPYRTPPGMANAQQSNNVLTGPFGGFNMGVGTGGGGDFHGSGGQGGRGEASTILNVNAATYSLPSSQVAGPGNNKVGRCMAIHTCIHKCTCICKYTHTHIHTHASAYMCMYTHTHTQYKTIYT